MAVRWHTGCQADAESGKLVVVPAVLREPTIWHGWRYRSILHCRVHNRVKRTPYPRLGEAQVRAAYARRVGRRLGQVWHYRQSIAYVRIAMWSQREVVARARSYGVYPCFLWAAWQGFQSELGCYGYRA